MNSTLAIACFVWTAVAFQQPNQDRPQAAETGRPEPGGAVIGDGQLPKKPAARNRAELEAEFKNALTGATLVGTWQMTTKAPDGDEPSLTNPRSEKYTINSATKMSDEIWVVSARIQFAENDVNVPVPVRVIWAEDTAMITLDDFPVPLLGTYSCRVMIHKGYYSGIWYSNVKNYGGVMSGILVKSADGSAKPETSPQKDK